MEAGDGPGARRAARWAFALLAVAHLLGCLHYFPPREIFSGEPVLTGDYVQHYLESVHRAEFLRDGSILGYSTAWSAGYVEGFGGLVANKPYNVIVALAPESLRPLAFNLTVLVLLWAFPLLVYPAARRFGQTPSRAVLAAALAAACWYGSMLFRVFWRAGSPTFLVGAAAAVWAGALLVARWRTDGERRPSLATIAFAVAFVPWIHSGALVVLAVVGAAVWIATVRERGLRLIEVAAVGSVAVVANLPWIVPLARYGDLRRSLYYGIYPGGLQNFLFDFVRGPLHLGTGPREETAILAWLSLLALPGFAMLRRRSVAVPVLAASAATFAILAYGGEPLGRGVGSLQPYRFVIPLAVLLSIAASGFPSWLASPRTAVRALALGVALVAGLGIADRLRVAKRAGDYLGAGLGRTESWALETLRHAAAPDGGRVVGRILAEGDWLVEPAPGRPTSKRITYSFVGLEGRIDAEFIGAPTMPVLTPAEEASFWVGKLFGRRIDAWDADSFRRLCELYGIRWVVTLRRPSTQALERLAPLVERVDGAGDAAVFRIILPPPPEVRSDGRWIEIEVDAARTIVLPYHWNPLLVARPPAAIRPVPNEIAATLPFIGVDFPAPGRYRIGID